MKQNRMIDILFRIFSRRHSLSSILLVGLTQRELFGDEEMFEQKLVTSLLAELDIFMVNIWRDLNLSS